MSRADRFDFTLTLDEDTEKRLYELLTDMDTRNTNRFWITDKRGYHAEYVKVRHGKWTPCMRDSRGCADMFKCSECERYSYYAYGVKCIDYKYCPHCGAKMDGIE